MGSEELYNGRLIYHTEDELGSIEVVERGDLRSLHFGTPYPQSLMALSDPFALVLEYSRIAMLSLIFEEPLHVLNLGLGGGSLPKFIWKYFPNSRVDNVEYRKAVIDIGYKYFELPLSERFAVTHAEASDFLTSTKNLYDIMFVDLFSADSATNLIASPSFITACYEKVMPGGMAVMNIWGSITREQMLECVKAIHASFQNNVLILPVEGTTNLLFFLFRDPLPLLTANLMEQRAADLTSSYHLDFIALLKKVNLFKGKGFIYQ